MASLNREYQVLICGLGAMGSATAYHLAKRGVKVLGLEQFQIAHSQGSSHGLSRIIRKAYFEHPSYVPLLKESYRLWRELEGESGMDLLTITGSLEISDPAGSLNLVECSRRAAELHGLPYELLTGTQVNERFPAYSLPSHFSALYQPDSGILAAENCLQAHTTVARRHGAQLLEGVRVLSWKAVGSTQQHVLVTADNGVTYEVERLILCSGPWIAQQVPELRQLCIPERQVVGWFRHNSPRHFSPESFPVFIIDDAEGPYYGFPEFQSPGSMKVARFGHLGQTGAPEDLMGSQVSEADVNVMRRCLQRYFPTVSRHPEQCSTCMFTNSLDSDFVIDHHPEYPQQVLLCSPCSGHGFKMSPVIGSIMADLALTGTTAHDIQRHSLAKQKAVLQANRGSPMAYYQSVALHTVISSKNCAARCRNFLPCPFHPTRIKIL